MKGTVKVRSFVVLCLSLLLISLGCSCKSVDKRTAEDILALDNARQGIKKDQKAKSLKEGIDAITKLTNEIDRLKAENVSLNQQVQEQKDKADKWEASYKKVLDDKNKSGNFNRD